MQARIITTAITLVFAFLFLLSPSILAADPPPCNGGNAQKCLFNACNVGAGSSSAACAEKNNNSNSVADTIRKAANIIASVAGVAAVIMIIISGITLAASGGNAEQASTARRRLTYSLVGLVVVALAYAITSFAIDNFVQ